MTPEKWTQEIAERERLHAQNVILLADAEAALALLIGEDQLLDCCYDEFAEDHSRFRSKKLQEATGICDAVLSRIRAQKLEGSGVNLT